MRYTITLLSASKGNEGALGPENSLDLKNLKITVSGHYDLTEEDDDEE